MRRVLRGPQRRRESTGGGYRHPAGETIALARWPRDERGRRATGDPQVIEVVGCAIERRETVNASSARGGNPTDDQRDTVITTVLVHTPPNSGAEHTDRVWLPGERRDQRPMWRMTSRPWPARNPLTGAYPGDVLELERVDG